MKIINSIFDKIHIGISTFINLKLLIANSINSRFLVN